MPIFMDRHDVSEPVTAEDIAQLHQEDIKVQHQFDCRGLTYWFDDKRKTAFCLIEAPDADAIRNMHNHAHGQVPHSVIEVEASIVESFLGRLEDPEKAQDTALNIINDPAFRTIMVITLEQSSLLHNDPAPTTSFLHHFRNAVGNILNIYQGTVVRQTGTQYLISFKSVSNTVHAAVDIRSLFNDAATNSTHLKIGISAGVPVTKQPSLFEDAITLA